MNQTLLNSAIYPLHVSRLYLVVRQLMASLLHSSSWLCLKITISLPLYGITVVIILITSACKKENDPLPANSSVVGKTYQIVSFTLNPALDLNGDGKADTDLTLLFSDCRKDDTVTFETGGKILTGFGTSKCVGDDTADRNGGTWTLDQSRNVVKTIDKDDPTEITEWVIEASGNTLRSVEQFDAQGVTYTSTLVMKAI